MQNRPETRHTPGSFRRNGTAALAGMIVTLLAVATAAPGALAEAAPGPRESTGLCEAAAETAAAETGVPGDLLRAIMLVESGRIRNGIRQGWPWAVNVGGQGTWYPDAMSARQAIDAVPADGALHVDIGCFQLNRHWHGRHFADTRAMLDPAANARHAARFLAALHDEFGTWQAAAAAYHSRNPDRAAAYAARLAAYWPAAHAGDRPPEGPREHEPEAGRGFPLLMSQSPANGASLFPVSARDAAPLRGAVAALIEGG